MKKTLITTSVLVVLFLLAFSVTVFAAPLSTLDITTDKAVVNPDGTVTINFAFGEDLGAYTFEVDFDDALFDYESSTGTTTASATGDKVTAYFFDGTGGTAPSSAMSLTFKAKTGLTSSNPTQFLITATGIANADASVTFDDITTPIVKDVLVEPPYENYAIAINYTGDIEKNVEKPIDVVITSALGRNYDHLRLVATLTKPSTAAVMQLKGTDASSLEHDVIQSGWGDPAGYALGGAAVNETYNFRGLFNEDGEYVLTLNLIDRDDSDKVIATVSKTITVGQPVVAPEPEPIETQEPETVLPKTGMNIYVYLTALLAITVVSYAIVNKKHK